VVIELQWQAIAEGHHDWKQHDVDGTMQTHPARPGPSFGSLLGGRR
jgi:hypothetical protein